MTVVIATHNRGKLAEWKILLAGEHVRDAGSFDLQAPDETGATYVDNARLKAQYVYEATGLPAWADDTGFESHGLGGRPGLRTAEYLREHGGRENAARVLYEAAGGDVRARLVCAVAWHDGTQVHSAQADIEGTLSWPPHDAPGLACLLKTDSKIVDGGVMMHRRLAFETLRTTCR